MPKYILKRRKQIKVPNVTIVGSPTINDNIVSEFSTSDYLKLPEILNLYGNSEVEIVFKFNTPTLANTIFLSQGAQASCPQILLELNSSGKLLFYTGSGSGSWYNQCLGTYTYNINTNYWIKAVMKIGDDTPDNEKGFYIYYSTDGKIYELDNFLNKTNPSLANMSVPQFIGYIYDKNGSKNANPGSIDLSESYIKINNELWWGGTKYETDDTGYILKRKIIDYYKFDNSSTLLNLRNSNNSAYINSGAFDIRSVTAWSTTQTYTLNEEIRANKLFINVTSSMTQANAGWTITITAITDQGEIEALTKNFGYGVAPNENFESLLSDVTKIEGIKIYAYCYRRSDQYCYGYINIMISNNKAVLSSKEDYDFQIVR